MTDSRLLTALRVAFLLLVAVFAWRSLHGRLDEVGAALRDTSVLDLGVALGLLLLGLLATGLVWLRLMAAVGAELSWREGLAMFFVGQLGKYIPGSVWSIGAQAQMAGRRSVPPRATVTAGLVFLGYHVATGVAAGMAVVLLGGLDAPWPTWLSAGLLLVSAVGLLPAVVRWGGSRVAGRPVSVHAGDSLLVVVLMAAAWLAYTAALVVLAPGHRWGDTAALGAAFALSYAVGVVVVIAPAGVGARETLFVVLITPLLGVSGATALALLARVAHTVADGAMAAGWWGASRVERSRREPRRPAAASR